MPFIRGRYHINPVMGEALEAAREAEAALLALEHGSGDGHDGADHANDQADGFASPHSGDRANDRGQSGPIRRVEIESAEQEGFSGRGPGEPGGSNPRGGTERGFVARVHRGPVAGGRGDSAGAASRVTSRPGLPSDAETHVFSNHRDLVNFLHHELAKGSADS